jgi:hypothetical protein
LSLTAAITWESMEAVPSIGPDWLSFDKLAHFAVFGMLATAVVRLERTRAWPLLAGWWAIVIVSAYGAGTELLQSLTPYRSMEFDDWVADTLGAVVAVPLYLRWAWYRRWLETPVGRRRPAAAPPQPRVDLSAAPVPNFPE